MAALPVTRSDDCNGATTHANIRVLHVIDDLGSGGAETSLAYVLPAMQDRHIDCEVAALHAPYDVADLIETKGVRVHRLGNGHPRFGSSVPSLWRLLRSQPFDIIQAHLLEASFSVAATAVASRRRVILFHNLAFDVHPPTTTRRRLHLFAEAAWTRSAYHAWVGVSRAAAKHYRELFRLPTVHVVPNAVAPPVAALLDECQSADTREQFGIPRGEPLLLMAAHFRPEKGHLTLIEALGLLASSGIRPFVLLVGDGPMWLPVQRRAVALDGADRIRLTGPLPHPDVLRLTAAADIIVLPSMSEGMGVAAAEGMIYGKPVVASRTGGLAEVVHDGVTGFLVPPGDASSLADRLAALVSKPDLRLMMGAAAAQEACARYDPASVAEQWAAIYRCIA